MGKAPKEELRISIDYDLFAFGKSPQAIGGGLALPPAYVATVDDPIFPFEVELKVRVENQRAQLDAVTLRRRESDPPIRARSLREVPAQRFLNASIVMAQLRYEQVEPGHWEFSRVREEMTERERTASRMASRRRTRTTDLTELADQAKRAVLLHEGALADEELKRRPTMYVAETMNVSRATASRLLKRGREQQKEG